MKNIERRLAAAERGLGLAKETELPGSIEIHWRDAWPARQDAAGIQPCQDHGPTCGVSVSRVRERRSVVIEMGPGWACDREVARQPPGRAGGQAKVQPGDLPRELRSPLHRGLAGL